MLLIAAAATALMLAGCAKENFGNTGELRPVGDGTYQAKLYADTAYPDGSASAEATRLRFLDSLMKKNGFCSAGYDVTARESVVRVDGLFGQIRDIYYTVECRSA